MFIYVGLHVCKHTACLSGAWVGPSGVGVTDAYDREGPLREQVFLATEPSLQPPSRIVEKCKRLQEEGSEADGAFEGGMKD